MVKVIKELLLKIIDSIDAGNSNITEQEAFEIIDIIKRYTDTTQYYNRTQAAKYYKDTIPYYYIQYLLSTLYKYCPYDKYYHI